jgi:hypothetical protein
MGCAIALDGGAVPLTNRDRFAERGGTRGAPQKNDDPRADDAELFEEMHPRMRNI